MKKKISLLLLVLAFFVFSIGISYAYFVYTQAGHVNTLTLTMGRNKRKTKKITEEEFIVSMEPMSVTTARTKTDNYFDFDVESENYGDEEASFCISVEYGTENDDKQRIPLRYISFDLENRASSNVYHLNNQTFDDINHMHCIYVKSQPAHDGTVTAKFRLRFWLNEGVTVSDTDTSSVFKATDNDPYDDRISYSDLYNSFVVTVESDSREEYHKAYTKIYNSSLASGLDSSTRNAKTLEFKYGYDETYDSIPNGFKNNNLQTSGYEPIYSYYDSTNYKLVVFSESYIYTTGSISSLFSSLTNLETIDFSNLYFNNVTSLSLTFKNLSHLQSLDLDVSTPLNASLYQTFYGCSGLTNVRFGEGFSTANVTTMQDMFRSCSSLTNLDLSKFEFFNNTSLSYTFYYCSNLEYINFGYCNFEKLTDMSYAFYSCALLEHIYWETTDTPLVTNFSYTFYNCPSLISVDLSNITFDSATAISSMFKYCESLLEVDLSNASKNNINTYIDDLFNDCTSLTVVKIPNLDLSGVTSTYNMFSNCTNLERIDSLFNFSNALASVERMFYYCSSLSSLNLNNMDVSNVTNFTSTFYHCSNLTKLDIFEWNTSSATSFGSMFYYCSSLEVIDISNFDNSSVTNYTFMFFTCSNLKTIYVNENWVPASGSSIVFTNDKKLVGGNGTVYSSNQVNRACIDTPEHPGYLTVKSSNSGDVVSSGNNMINLNSLCGNNENPNDYNLLFNSITSLKFDDRKHDGFKFDISVNGDGSVMMYVDGNAAYISSKGVTVFPANSSSMFSKFINLEKIDTNHHIDTSNITNFGSFFRYTAKLKSLDMEDFDLTNVTNFGYTFNYSGVTTVDLSGKDLTKCTSFDHTFFNCSNLTSVDFTGTTTYATTYFCMFYGCTSLTNIDLSGFDTSRATSIRGMFRDCSSLITLDLSSFDTTNVTTMYNLFNNCSKLVTIYVSSSFVTTNLTDNDTSGDPVADGHAQLFKGCSSLVGGNGTTFTTGNTSSDYAVIDTASTPGYFTLKS